MKYFGKLYIEKRIFHMYKNTNKFILLSLTSKYKQLQNNQRQFPKRQDIILILFLIFVLLKYQNYHTIQSYTKLNLFNFLWLLFLLDKMSLLPYFVAIIILIVCKQPLLRAVGFDPLKPKKNIMHFLSDIKRWDQIFRLLQFTAIFLAGYFQLLPVKFAQYAYFAKSAKISNLNNFSKVMFSFRQIIRFYRSPSLFQCVANNWKRVNYGICEGKIIDSLIILAQMLTTFFFAVMFSLDGFSLACQIFEFSGHMHYEEIVDEWCQYLWIGASTFCILSNAIKILRFSVEKKKEMTKKQHHFAWIDLSRAILDITTAYAFLNQGFIQRRTLGVIGIATTFGLMSDYLK